MQPRKQEHTKTAFVIASLALSTVPAHAQNQPRFRSGVEVTSIDVTVVDDDGRPVSDLSPADFTVRVDDTPRRIPFPAGPAGDRGPGGVEPGGELEAVAAAAGGAMFTVAMSADQALARIESELSGYYLLGVESSAADGDGKPHALRVDVNRRGVAVRAGRYLPGPAP